MVDAEIEEEKKAPEEDVSIVSFKSDHRNKQQLSFGQKILQSVYPGAANDPNIRNSFPLKYFSCCLPKPEVELEISDLDSNSNHIYMCDELVDEVMSLFPSKYLRKDERAILKFDKKGIMKFFDDLAQAKGFIRKFEKFDQFGLRMFMKDQNEFSSSIPVTRCQIEIPKNLFSNIPSVERVGLAIIDPERRTFWDKHFKEYKILKQLNQDTETLKIVTNRAMNMLDPREFYEKRTHFIENGVFYSYSSSAPDSFRPPKKEPIRAMDYFGIFKVEEDNNSFFIDGFHQIDIKIGQPGPLIFMSLPLKMVNFTKDLIKFLNS
jgi:hypothetical protein